VKKWELPDLLAYHRHVLEAGGSWMALHCVTHRPADFIQINHWLRAMKNHIANMELKAQAGARKQEKQKLIKLQSEHAETAA
jgi:hypothetical protein